MTDRRATPDVSGVGEYAEKAAEKRGCGTAVARGHPWRKPHTCIERQPAA